MSLWQRPANNIVRLETDRYSKITRDKPAATVLPIHQNVGTALAVNCFSALKYLLRDESLAKAYKQHRWARNLQLKADGSLNFTPTSNVGVTLAWRVLHSSPSLQINKEPANNAARLETDS
ncbi:hypothetical protein CWC28_05250 [Pseudoalteromonas sp. S4492]|nr:hypothetical protein CWC28_05250 [Pseudoalteromonas sp. S4492]